MKQVHKKSDDEAVNQLLVAAYRQRTDLAWDRAEAQQPQCGFGQLGICCSHCYDGPCRINPFGSDEQRTICGRAKSDLAGGSLVRSVADGSLALLKLAREFGAEVSADDLAAVMTSEDEMLGNGPARLQALGGLAAKALDAIAQAKRQTYGADQPGVSKVNLGALNAQAVNVVVHGHVAPGVIQALTGAAAKSSATVNLSAVCGADAGGRLALPVLTNYESQEAVLLTGAVDLLVVGSQCVMPAMIVLAAKLNVAVVEASALKEAAAVEAALQTASEAFRRRAGKAVNIPPVVRPLHIGGIDGGLTDALKASYAKGVVQGVVYLGGCGSFGSTQDTVSVQLARQLLKDGYVVVTAGCAGVSLAKAGMTDPAYDEANPALRAALPAGLPAVVYIGACHDVAGFLGVAEALKDSAVPVFAVMPQITHHKTLATAAAFAAKGITTLIGLEGVFTDAATRQSLGRDGILPLAELAKGPKGWNEAAAN
jgi:hydroxylamine reductase (hybrid-cluster protein)